MREDDLRGRLGRHQGAGVYQASAGGGGRCWAQLPDVWKSWRWQDVDRSTLADLIGAERIETAHLAEAIQYRPRWQV
jgi:hypothetical protein